jgi:hypothetical protein
MEVRYDLPDFCRRMLAAQPADGDGVETNLSDEARCNISSVRVAAPWGMSAFEGKADIVWT